MPPPGSPRSLGTGSARRRPSDGRCERRQPSLHTSSRTEPPRRPRVQIRLDPSSQPPRCTRSLDWIAPPFGAQTRIIESVIRTDPHGAAQLTPLLARALGSVRWNARHVSARAASPRSRRARPVKARSGIAIGPVRMAVTYTDGTDSTGRSYPETWNTTGASAASANVCPVQCRTRSGRSGPLLLRRSVRARSLVQRGPTEGQSVAATWWASDAPERAIVGSATNRGRASAQSPR